MQSRMRLRRGALGVLASALLTLLAACGARATAARTPTTSSAAGVTATATTPAVTVTATAIASAATCTTAQLTANSARSSASLGNVRTDISLQNNSHQTCSLDGYPELQMLDANGQAVPTHVTDATSAYVFSDRQPSMVVLAPGAMAYFILQWNYYDVTTGQSCPSSPTSTSLQLTPPGVTGTVMAKVALTPCDGKLITSPIVAQE